MKDLSDRKKNYNRNETLRPITCLNKTLLRSKAGTETNQTTEQPVSTVKEDC